MHFESKSQHTTSSAAFHLCCLSISQRYILKANHNLLEDIVVDEVVVYQ